MLVVAVVVVVFVLVAVAVFVVAGGAVKRPTVVRTFYVFHILTST